MWAWSMEFVEVDLGFARKGRRVQYLQDSRKIEHAVFLQVMDQISRIPVLSWLQVGAVCSIYGFDNEQPDSGVWLLTKFSSVDKSVARKAKAPARRRAKPRQQMGSSDGRGLWA